jgi:integrase
LGDLQLRKLTTIIIQGWVNILAKRIGHKTIVCAYGLLTAVLNTYAPKIEIGKITFPQKKKFKSVALSRHEIAILLDGIQDMDIEVPILLALWLGLRRSEILALEWSDIDFNKNTITISKALVPGERQMHLKEPKTTESERTLALPLYIADKMKNLKHNGERIFEGMDPNRCTKKFPKVCEQLGLPHYRFHDLRHSMATVGVTLNIADKVVMARGGWSNYSTMKNIYQAVLQDDTVMANTMYDTYFNELLPTL